MGAWGTGSFMNDDALDWIDEFEAEGVSAVDALFMEVRAEVDEGYIEAPSASMVVAAGELIAAAHGFPMTSTGPAADIDREILARSMEAHGEDLRRSSDLAKQASALLEVVVADPAKSELLDLWQETDDLDAFLASVSDLKNRLGRVK